MKPNLPVLIAAAVLCAPVAIQATEQEHVGRNLERGEPSRWEVPANTPAERLELALQEARAALAEALADCRARSDRKSCEAEARARRDREVADARSRFSPR